MAGIFVDEFRGTDNLVYAEVLTDNNNDGEGYSCGAVKILAPVAEISKTTETGSDTHYYDNKPAIVISSEGSDTITLTVAALGLDTLAEVTGKQVDPETGALMDGERVQKYYALGYRLKLIGDKPGYRYVWRYKGTFAIPEEKSSTENADTDATNQELTYTGISTNHIFTKPNAVQKALVVDEADGKADVSTFFDQVTTIDTLISVDPVTMRTVTNNLTHVNNTNAATKVADGTGYAAILTAATGYTMGTVTVTMGGVDVTATAYDSDTGAIVITNVSGNIVITATATASV